MIPPIAVLGLGLMIMAFAAALGLLGLLCEKWLQDYRTAISLYTLGQVFLMGALLLMAGGFGAWIAAGKVA